MKEKSDGLKGPPQACRVCGQSGGDRKGTVATGVGDLDRERRREEGGDGRFGARQGTIGAGKVCPRQTARTAAQVCRCPGWVKSMCGTWLSRKYHKIF